MSYISAIVVDCVNVWLFGAGAFGGVVGRGGSLLSVGSAVIVVGIGEVDDDCVVVVAVVGVALAVVVVVVVVAGSAVCVVVVIVVAGSAV